MGPALIVSIWSGQREGEGGGAFEKEGLGRAASCLPRAAQVLAGQTGPGKAG